MEALLNGTDVFSCEVVYHRLSDKTHNFKVSLNKLQKEWKLHHWPQNCIILIFGHFSDAIQYKLISALIVEVHPCREPCIIKTSSDCNQIFQNHKFSYDDHIHESNIYPHHCFHCICNANDIQYIKLDKCPDIGVQDRFWEACYHKSQHSSKSS